MVTIICREFTEVWFFFLHSLHCYSHYRAKTPRRKQKREKRNMTAGSGPGLFLQKHKNRLKHKHIFMSLKKPDASRSSTTESSVSEIKHPSSTLEENITSLWWRSGLYGVDAQLRIEFFKKHLQQDLNTKREINMLIISLLHSTIRWRYSIII